MNLEEKMILKKLETDIKCLTSAISANQVAIREFGKEIEKLKRSKRLDYI